MNVQEEIDKLNEYGQEMRKSREAFIKQILLMSSGLLGILVSLHKVSALSEYSRISFSVAICSLGLSILGLSVGLYHEVSLYKKLHSFQRGDILRKIQDPGFLGESKSVNPSKVYQYFETFGYFSFLVSILSLVIYAVSIA